MRRRLKNAINFASLLTLSAFFGYIVYQASTNPQRLPANAGAFTQNDFDHATLSVSMSEFQNSKPAMGRSYFDLVFSESSNNQTQYKIPFPFNKMISKLEDYSGKKVNPRDASGPKVVLFPMGRSLQRNAAVQGLNQAFSFDPFFRFPRVVVGIDEETTHENSLLLNLKNKIYIGYNERAEILEAISYNDEEGRFEYQIIRDYAEGKTPKVVYANRSLCLSCHQNQTPIFSRGPWSESNANVQMSDQLKQKLDAAFKTPACADVQNLPYCYKNFNEPYYFGAPIRIDLTTTSKFDASTDAANLFHAYQKMWKELCVTAECRYSMIQAILQFRLTGQAGLLLTPNLDQALKLIDQQWQQKFKGGLAIPSPNVPNRDPLKDVVSQSASTSFSTVAAADKTSVQDLIAQSKIPTEFEPLLARSPVDLWKDSGLDVTNTNRMLRGFADEFTTSDIKMIDQWLKKNKTDQEVIAQITSKCQVDKDGANIAISCEGGKTESFSLNTYIPVNDRSGQGEVSDVKMRSQAFKCDPTVPQTDTAIFQGRSCPSWSNIIGGYYKVNDEQSILFLQFKDGTSLRTLHGFYVAEVFLDTKSSTGIIKIYNQSQLVMNALKTSQDKLLKMNAFSRFHIMKAFNDHAKLPMIEVQNISAAGLPFHVEGEVSLDAILASANGPALLKTVCAQCHKNDEAVPPNFMGPVSQNLTDVEICRRVEQCAPRILYRLKMRNCETATSGKKKNPMPPEFFLRNNKIAAHDWMKSHNPKIVQYLKTLIDQGELSKDLQTHGMPADNAQSAATDILNNECPSSNSVIYDQLPKCEFNNLKPMTRCR